MSSPYYYSNDGSGRRSSQQPQPLQPIQSASGRQSTSSSVLPDTSGQTQPLYENQTQQAGHYWGHPASESTFQPSTDSQVTSSHQQPDIAYEPGSQYYAPASLTPHNPRYRHGDPQYSLPSHAPPQAASFEGHNDAQTHIPFSDSGHSRHVPSSFHSHDSPQRQRQGIPVPSNPLYTSHPQSERRGQQDYPQPHWQQQHSSPPRSADPQYSDFGHTSAPSQPSRPQYTSPQGSYTSPSQPVAHYNTQRSTHQYIGTHPIPPNHDIQNTAGQSTHTRSYNVPGEGNPVPSTWGYTPQSVPAVPNTSTQSSLSVVGHHETFPRHAQGSWGTQDTGPPPLSEGDAYLGDEAPYQEPPFTARGPPSQPAVGGHTLAAAGATVAGAAAMSLAGGSHTSGGQRRQQPRRRETDRRHPDNDGTSNRRLS
ncbi:hypothetical protein BJV78DRAFT_1283104 [Lactifluus subvellereus]|nr:hypothetical protein BJV78DRAFT_1283104 [Lactifluus subvellereus]